MATLLVALGTLQFPILSALDAYQSAWVKSGGVDLPFLLTGIFNLIGIHLLAKLIGVKSPLLSIPLVIACLIVIPAAATFMPATRTDLPPVAIAFTMAFFSFEAVAITICASLLYSIKTQAGGLYKPAFQLLFWSYAIDAVAGILRVAVHPFVPYGNWFSQYNILAALYVVGGLLLLMAAKEFYRLGLAEKSINSTRPASGAQDTSVDIVIALAGLVSNPHAVDPTLNRLRAITARQNGHQTLDDKEQAEIAKIYLQLEQYLINQEPVRKFSLHDVRQMTELRFRGSVNEPTFWENIESVRQTSPA